MGTMDIETMALKDKDKHIPICISIYTSELRQVFLINKEVVLTDPNKAVQLLWKDFFNYIITHKIDVIFAHNLGGFDGLFIYKGLCSYTNLSNFSCLMDDQNKFISITLNMMNLKIVFKDSYRIFPLKLEKLAEAFGVPGKLLDFDVSKLSLQMFKDNNNIMIDRLIEYNLQDTVCLYNILEIARKRYLLNYKIDIANIIFTFAIFINL